MKTDTKRQAKKYSRVPADRNQWSESSKRTYAHIEYYEDFSYTCRGCDQSFVFTAEEQKQAFEGGLVYIYWRPTLCDACAAKKQSAAESISQYEARWKANKQKLQHDLSFLKRWLGSLEAYAHLSGRRSHSVIQMLQKLIRRNS